jgi:hypothetical protein
MLDIISSPIIPKTRGQRDKLVGKISEMAYNNGKITPLTVIGIPSKSLCSEML